MPIRKKSGNLSYAPRMCKSKFLLLFGNMRHTSIISVAFAPGVVTVMNHPGLWDAELAWYSLSATLWICHNDFEYGLSIYTFKLTWLCQIVEVLTTRVKFLEPPVLLNFDQLRLQICTRNIFGRFRGVISQFELAKHKLANVDWSSDL